MPPPDSDSDDRLRAEAEARLQTAKEAPHETHSPMDAGRLVHELRVNQIELEIQNQELRRTQLQFALEVERYADLFDLSPIGYLTLDPDGKITEFNPAASEFLRAARARLTGRLFQEFICQPDRQRLAIFLADVFAAGKKHRVILTLESPGGGEVLPGKASDGTPRVVQVEATISTSGKHCRVALVDISELKQMQESLASSEERYRTIFHGVQEGLQLLSRDGRMLAINAAARDMLGYSSVETANLFVDSLDWSGRDEHGEPLPPEQYPFYLAIRTGTLVRDRVMNVRRGDGRLVSLLVSAQPIIDAAGRVKEVIQSFYDITERLENEEKLRTSAQLLEASQAIAKVGGWELDLVTNELFWTDETYRLHDTTPGEFVPSVESGVAFYRPESRRILVADLQAAMTQGEGFDRELDMLTAQGRLVHVRVTGEVTRAEGRPSKVTGIFQDITARKEAEKKLRQSTQLLETSQLIAKVGGWEVDLVNDTRFWTQETYRIMEGSPDEPIPAAVGRLELYSPESRRIIAEARQTAIEHGTGFDLELDALTCKGRRIKVRMTGEVTLHEGHPVKLTGIIQDITAAKGVEAKLKASEEFARATLNSLAANICVLDAAGVVIAVNESWQEFAQANGGGSGDTIGTNYLTVCRQVTGESRPFAVDVATAIEDALKDGATSFKGEYPCHSPEEKRWFSVQISRFKGTGPKRVVVVHENITPRKMAEQQLIKSRAQLRELAGRLVNAREDESSRIARSVHDDLGQQLTGMKMDLRLIERRLEAVGGAPVNAIIDQVVATSGLVDDTIRTVQGIAANLRPPILDQIGLVAALRRELKLLETRSGLTCRYRGTADELPLYRDLATACFRIAQEALTNVARHAAASLVEVELTTDRNTLIMEIRDNGKGVKQDLATMAQSLGVLGMQERAHLVAGEVVITNRLEGGTSVRAQFPLDGAAERKGQA